MNPIYSNYRNRSQSLETTLSLMQEILSERLSPEYRRIWVQGSNVRGGLRFCITVFDNNSYRQLFQELRNFRNWRQTEISEDGDIQFGIEIVNIENLIESLRRGCLSGIII